MLFCLAAGAENWATAAADGRVKQGHLTESLPYNQSNLFLRYSAREGTGDVKGGRLRKDQKSHPPRWHESASGGKNIQAWPGNHPQDFRAWHASGVSA